MTDFEKMLRNRADKLAAHEKDIEPKTVMEARLVAQMALLADLIRWCEVYTIEGRFVFTSGENNRPESYLEIDKAGIITRYTEEGRSGVIRGTDAITAVHDFTTGCECFDIYEEAITFIDKLIELGNVINSPVQ